MSRSKSASSSTPSKVTSEEIRSVCKLIAPYIVHEWRDVCEELGVSDEILDEIESDHVNSPMSELAFRGLCKWQDMVGRTASKDTLQRVIKLFGLRRADEQLRSLSQKRTVPYMGRPDTAAVTQEVPANKQAKQKALADRLSRPKSTRTSDQDLGKQKKMAPQLQPGVNPLAVQVTPSKPTDICEVKLKITVKGVQRTDKDEIEQTHDDFKSTKDDFKNTCFNFVKLVMANRRAHFHELKELLGLRGISVQRLSQIGFNINVFLLCSSLGAFEILYQNYTTGRLKKVVHSALVTHDHLIKLNARQMELSVEMEEGMINKYRDILIVRGPAEEDILHPVDVLDYFQCDDDDEDCSLNKDLNIDEIRNFSLKTWHQDLHSQIVKADKKYQEFNDSIKDLLMILRIARRQDKPEMTCLQDVINCYHHLKYSKTVAAQGSRSDIVLEYLSIVNFIRITVQEISDKSILVSFDETLHPDACEAFHRLLAQTEEMLHPTHIFESDDSVTNAHVMTGLEKEMFGSFLCYLPKLLQLLYNLCDTLTATVNEESVEEGTSDEDSSKSMDRNDSGIALSKEENNNSVKVQDKNSEKQTVYRNNTLEQSSTDTDKSEQISNTSVVSYLGTWKQA